MILIESGHFLLINPQIMVLSPVLTWNNSESLSDFGNFLHFSLSIRDYSIFLRISLHNQNKIRGLWITIAPKHKKRAGKTQKSGVMLALLHENFA
jgi:ribosomal protein L5